MTDMTPTTKPGEADLTALREKFEAWFCEDGNYEPEWLDWNRAGMYSNADTQNMFEAFQAGATLGTAPATPVPAKQCVKCECDASIILSTAPALVVNGSNASMEELSRRLATPAPAPGWKLVPVEPTRAMLAAYVRNHCSCAHRADGDWAAMLNATPTSPAPAPATQADVRASDLNTGHGHVFPRPDGMVAKCGGPPLCMFCKGEASRL